MEMQPISQDDLTDVMEMTHKLETYTYNVLQGNQRTLAMSALMSAFTNCMLSQCETLHEVVTYRNLFIGILDDSIRSIGIKGPEKPSS